MSLSDKKASPKQSRERVSHYLEIIINLIKCWQSREAISHVSPELNGERRQQMEQEVVITILQKMFVMILELSVPVLFISMFVGLLVSVFQTITQIQESTLTFVPKIVAGVITLIVLLPWMTSVFISGVNELFDTIPSLIRG